MVIWTLFGVLGSVVAGLTAYVTWRDSRRSPASERVVIPTAMPAAYRYGSDSHPEQHGP